MYIIAAISIGLLGSLHCMGMCGPIQSVVLSGKFSFLRHLIYQSGRILTYSVFGAVAGTLGATFNVMGFQQYFSIVMGAILVLGVLIMPISKAFQGFEALLSGRAIQLTSLIHQTIDEKNTARFAMGLINGILPCGLVYLAVAGAANTFTPWDGALFMVFFGIGTLPMLIAVQIFKSTINAKARSKFRKLVPVTLLVMGLLLIARGMNLGIPYLSPQKPTTQQEVAECD